MWGNFVYREMVAPERIVFIKSFSDEQVNLTRPPFSPNWPLEVLSTLTFAGHDGRTALTLQGVPLSATELERNTFKDGRSSMQQGLPEPRTNLPNIWQSPDGPTAMIVLCTV